MPLLISLPLYEYEALTSQWIKLSLGPSRTFTKTPESLSHTKTLCAILCPAPPITYSPSPENPTACHGVLLTRSWNLWIGFRTPVRGETWNVRMARSEEEMTMFLECQLCADSLQSQAYCPRESNAICLMVAFAILSRWITLSSANRHLKAKLAHLPSERIKDDNLALIRPRIYPRSTRRPHGTSQSRDLFNGPILHLIHFHLIHVCL
jgi:hypothetical protein